MKIALKNVKMMQGRDGMVVNATVYLDGKCAGIAIDDGNGGELMVDPMYNADATAWAKLRELRCDERLVNAVEQLLYEWEFKKQIKEWSRKHTPFRLKGDKKGEWRTVRRRYDAAVQKYLNDKYGDKIEIIGSLFCKEPVEGDLDELATKYRAELEARIADMNKQSAESKQTKQTKSA